VTDDGAHLFLLCEAGAGAGQSTKRIYRGNVDGTSWTLVGNAPMGGDPGTISAGSDNNIVVSAVSAASWLYVSHDGGRHWSTALTETDGGNGWNDLGFTNTDDAVVVHITSTKTRTGDLLLSGNGGSSWSTVKF
jgi:hypothetical protein